MYKKDSEYCVRVSACQTTTGYIVNGHYFDKIIENIKTGISKLIRNPTQGNKYAIDKYWFNLQRVDKWFLIIPLSVIQRKDYSNIEKRNIDYTKIMLMLDKPHLNIKQSP